MIGSHMSSALTQDLSTKPNVQEAFSTIHPKIVTARCVAVHSPSKQEANTTMSFAIRRCLNYRARLLTLVKPSSCRCYLSSSSWRRSFVNSTLAGAKKDDDSSSPRHDDFDAPISYQGDDDTNTKTRGESLNLPRRFHRYERDLDFDKSQVDEKRINELLAKRFRAKIDKDYNKADAIRDELREVHGVMVLDDLKTWRSGCFSFYTPQQDFGPHGHDYQLSAEAGPNQSDLTEGEIHQLIAKRLRHKLTKNFAMADQTKQELENMGVFLDDHKKEWRADGKMFRRKRNLMHSEQEEFGPRGHDYKLAADAGPNQSDMTEDEIHGLIAKRLRHKLNKNFAEADQIQQELQDKGVFVNERTREWRADGIKLHIAQNEHGHCYKLAADAGPNQSDLTEDEIHRLLANRLRYRLKKNFDAADKIQQELQEKGVFVNERTREWRWDGKMFNRYTHASHLSISMPSEQEYKEIQAMVHKRQHARQNGDFDVSDEIMRTLEEEYNVLVNDKTKKWSVGRMPN